MISNMVAILIFNIFSLAYAEDVAKVDLNDIITHRQIYHGITVKFDCRFKEKSDAYDILGGFSPEYYINFSVWPAVTKSMEEGNLTMVYPYLYVPKEVLPKGNMSLVNKVLCLKEYDLIEIKGVVRNRRDFPLIEVIEINPVKEVSPLNEPIEGILETSIQKLEEIEKRAQGDEIKKELYLATGRIYVKQNNYDKAREVYEKLWEMDKENVEVNKRLSEVFLAKNEYKKALGMLRKTVRLAPDDPELHWLLSQAYEMGGDISQAEQEIERAKELVKANVERDETNAEEAAAKEAALKAKQEEKARKEAEKIAKKAAESE